MRLRAKKGDRILQIEPEAVPGILKTGRPKGLFYAKGKLSWMGVDSRGKKSYSYYHNSFPHVLAWLRQVSAPVNPTPEEREALRRAAELEREREMAERMHWKTLVDHVVYERKGEDPDSRELYRRWEWSREAEELLVQWVRDGTGEEQIAARFGITPDAVSEKKRMMELRIRGKGKGEDDR